MPEDAPALTYSQHDGFNLMPWHIKAGEDGLLRDSILVATMNGNEILTISLHVASVPLPFSVGRDAAESQSEQ